MQKQRKYICIDLKSFYASVECRERGLDPMRARLVVADPERSRGTICLAVSPALKAMGIPGRCRMFEIPQGIDYITAQPRMQLYIDYSVEIYGIYLKYISKEDIHVYSIDEVFMDVTDYLSFYGINAHSLAVRIMQDILKTTGIPAAAGIGTNLYLAKVALDLLAKHALDRIGILDERLYRKTFWNHRPLTDFWRIGPGIARRLSDMGILTMKDIAHADERILYRIFGVDAELLIDHAWGRESVTISDIQSYRPKEKSISVGQVLPRNYSFSEALLIVREMADELSIELTTRGLAANSLTLQIGYAHAGKMNPVRGTETLKEPSQIPGQLIPMASRLFERIADHNIPIRRLHLTCTRAVRQSFVQYDLFTDPKEIEKQYRLQKTVIDIKNKYGKNALLRGMDLQKAATARQRNRQIGGHKSGYEKTNAHES